jgi:iron(II)-dependent oxidoreductase
VDAYPAQNEFGCFDLVGNVRQWTCSLWGEKRICPDPRYAYPWKDDRRNDLNASRQIRRVVRGSSITDDRILLRCSARSGQLPEDAGFHDSRQGFRIVMLV